MDLKLIAGAVILLAGALFIAGCTGPSSAPAAIPDPMPAATTVPAPSAPAAAPTMTMTYAWTTETPYAGHPYKKTYTFEATGDYDMHTITTDSDRAWEFVMTYPGEGDFLVLLQDNGHTTIEVLADTAKGSAPRSRSVTLPAGTYWLDVKADAPWTITMSTG